MQVSQTGYSHYITATHATAGKHTHYASVQTNASASDDKVSLSQQGKQLQENWQSLADNYDVTNISQREMHALSDALYQGGFIGRGELLVLGAPRSMNADANSRHNFLGKMQQSLSRFSNGMPAEAQKHYQGAIDVLQALANSRKP
ncbi:hypothetical protein GCM10009092_08670 [Bowmanella denitrificans]|uniref:Uncharacterized protein n=1 Tax=Bowmanella denitrificans TaxID=366582 RepID=A0ABN0WTP3_9ALTE